MWDNDNILNSFNHIRRSIFNTKLKNMTILPAKNLTLENQRAKQQNKNILILMHLETCPWCHFVIDEVIAPMAEIQQYTNQLIIRQIAINAGLEMVDFDGQLIKNNTFARYYRIDFYPTLLLFNPQEQLLEKVIGVASKDFYWTELDKLLEKHSGVQT